MPGAPVVLDMFGGIVSTARPESLPEGASPRNNDVDFVVGRFTQRPGTQSVYTNVLTGYGPITATSATDVDTEAMPWTNPANILLNDGSYATNALLGQTGVQSVTITQGGYYALTETPVVSFSGTGAGASATVVTATITPPSGPQYKTVTGVTGIVAGAYTSAITVSFTGAASSANNATGTVVTKAVAQTSDNIRLTNFTFAVPANYQIKGFEVSIKGFAPSATVYAQLLKGGVLVGASESIALPTSNGTVTLGTQTDLWGSTWLYSDVDSPNFGCEIWVNASAAETVSLDFAEITVFGTPPAANFNGITEANLNETDQVTLALDANGLTWKEDVTNSPGVLALDATIPAAVPGSYLKGVDANGVAYMAYSDLTQGTSQPMQYNGSWTDRITQVGPGQAPIFTPQQSTSDTFNIVQITQPAQMSDPHDPGHFQGLLWSAGPGSTAPGNVITVYYADSFVYPQDTDLTSAVNSGNPVYVYVSTTPIAAANGTFLVTSIGNAIPPGGSYYRWYFTYNVPSSSYQFYGGPDNATGYYQRTLATMNVATSVPGLSVGNQITISGNSQASYNASWSISQALNSGEMTITSSAVSGGIATMGYALVTGSAPTAGQSITITNTTNAGGALNGTFTVATSTAFGGTVNTSGTAVTYVAGNNFTGLTNGEAITIAGTAYTIATVNSSTSITLTTSAGTLTDAVYSAGTVNTGTFTMTVPISGTYPSLPENPPDSAVATTAGNIFCFDPGILTLGTPTDPIYGTGNGGTFIFSSSTAQFITAGTKQGSVFFITRNGAVTRPAPPTNVVIPANTGAIIASRIPIGPPNVVARGITFTESGQNGVQGANFYYYDTPETYLINDVSYTSDALIIPNNTATTATFSFSDTVLLASDEIDIPGNDYFNLIEIGSPAWMFQYANRMLYGLCQTMVHNLLNMSFDGGYIPTLNSSLPVPLGWSVLGNGNIGSYSVTGFSITSNVVTIETVNSLQVGYSVIVTGLTTGTYLNNVLLVVDTVTGTSFTASFAHADVSLTTDSGTVTVADSSIGLVTSLDFGNAFRITNYGATAWTDAAILIQSAYQDYLGVNILQPNTPYSVRVKARSLTADSQTVTIQLPTYSGGAFGTSLGSASFVFNQGGYVIQSAPLVTGSGIAVIPSTLQIAIGVSALAAGAGIEIDRIEVYPTDDPVNTTTVLTSYVGNFEAVDINTGRLGVGTENPQPATGAFEILEQLYIQKTRSLQVTQDSPNYEPNNWQVKQASDRAGAVGPNAFDEGEEFAVSASRQGVYFFDGGKPMPILRELQSTGNGLNLWEYLNWDAGSKIWIRNDLNTRRLLIGIPLITPNPWLPNAAALTPTSPNVILMCNYTGCPTGEEMAMAPEVHITMFGDLKTLDMRRKWSLWQIPCPVGEFVTRPDTFSNPIFLCNGIASSKIYQLVNGAPSGGQNTDDGAAINWNYCTYGFTTPKQGQQTGLGALRKVWYYLAATMEGVGQVAAKLYSNSLGALVQNTFTIPLPFTLSYPQQNDQERVLEIGGQRVFVEFSSVGTGGYAEIGPLILDGEVDKNSPHRGVAS